MPIDILAPMYQLPKMKNEQIDVDIIESKLYADFEENASQQEGIIYEVHERLGKEYMQESELHTQVDSKKLMQKNLSV